MIGQKGLPATYGGIERHVEEIARRLVQRGHKVDVFCRFYYTPDGGSFHGIRLLRRPSLHTKHLDTATHVAWCTLEAMLRRYDVVHFHALGPSVFAGLPPPGEVAGYAWGRLGEGLSEVLEGLRSGGAVTAGSAGPTRAAEGGAGA